MPVDFKDRVSAKPGRVRITPENGTAAFYAKMERADEPSVNGTPLNAENLNKAQETLVYTDDTSISTHKALYISPVGSDDNTGLSAAAPMQTVKGAIRKYAKWHKMLEIYLADGTYNEDFGRMTLDQCHLVIRSSSDDMNKVTINLTKTWETNLLMLRLLNITLNVTGNDVRAIAVAAGMLYASNVRINLPAASTSYAVGVYYGANAWFLNCILNSGTSAGAAIFGNQALHIRAVNCTSERTIYTGVYANAGSVIEYTPTLTAYKRNVQWTLWHYSD